MLDSMESVAAPSLLLCCSVLHCFDQMKPSSSSPVQLMVKKVMELQRDFKYLGRNKTQKQSSKSRERIHSFGHKSVMLTSPTSDRSQ